MKVRLVGHYWKIAKCSKRLTCKKMTWLKTSMLLFTLETGRGDGIPGTSTLW